MTLGFSPRRALALLRVEARQLLSDRAALILILGLPVMQILLYGYGVRFLPRDVPVAAASDDRLAATSLALSLKGDPVLRLVGPVGAPGTARRAVEQGRASVGVEVAAADQAGPTRVRLYVNGADPATVLPAVARLQLGVWRKAAQLYGAGNAPEVSAVWLRGSPDRDAWAVAPGLAGVVVMVSMLFLGAVTLVRERERGTWEALLSTPIRPAEALVGKLAPYVLIGAVQSAILLAVERLLFGVPLPWPALALLAAAPLLAADYLMLGFVFSAAAETQLQALQGAVAVYLPSLLFSGFLFPFSGLPAWAQAVGEALPLTHYLRASRAVLLEGAPPSAVLLEVGPMALFGLAALGVAVLAYRRRLD